jgi:integrase
MSIRKRAWTTRTGEAKEAWIVDYFDQDGVRHIETRKRKKDAEARAQEIGINVRAGTHTPAAKSITVAEAAADWIRSVEREKCERSTVAQCQQHAKHIKDRLGGNQKLAGLTAPKIEAFKDNLLETMSRPMAKKVLTSLKWMLRVAHGKGNVAQNVALATKIKGKERDKKKVQAGVDFPTPDEVRHILAAVTGRQRAFLITATFTGLRGSELRGLPWKNVDLKSGELHVRQRADRYNKIGPPKSQEGTRSIPIGPMVVNTLREWRLACPPSDLDLMFPTRSGYIIRHENLIRQIFMPAQIAAGVTVPVRDPHGKPKRDAEGKTLVEAKYTGLHALRHFYASWCINRRQDGGLELPAKMVQARLGHASIAMTLDIYGHLFPHGDDGSELAEAERALLA